MITTATERLIAELHSSPECQPDRVQRFVDSIERMQISDDDPNCAVMLGAVEKVAAAPGTIPEKMLIFMRLSEAANAITESGKPLREADLFSKLKMN